MKSINFKKRWEAKHPLYRLEAVMRASIDSTEIIANEQAEILILINNSTASAYYDKNNLTNAQNVGALYIKNRNNIKKFVNEAGLTSKKLIELSKTSEKNIKRMTNEELHSHFQKFFSLFSRLFAFYNLSRPDYLIGIDERIKTFIKNLEDNQEKQDKIFTDLTAHTENSKLNLHDLEQLLFTKTVQEHKDFKKHKNLKQLIKEDDVIFKKLKQLINNFSWISAQEGSEAFSRDYYIEKINILLKNNKNAIQEKIEEIKKKPQKVRQKKNELIKKYKINNELKSLTDSVGELTGLRLNIRLWWTEASFFSLPLFQELNNRIGLNQKKLHGFCYSEYLLRNEVLDFLLGQKIITNNDIKKRAKNSLLLMKEKNIKFFVGEEAKKIEKQYIHEDNLSNIKKINGRVANKGFVRAKAWVISPSVANQLEKASQMKKGFVLVAAMTRPQFIDAISKSSAIITDEGGITCHAAIISREFNKPCIIGTHNATKIIKDNDLLEVDADNGIIKIINN